MKKHKKIIIPTLLVITNLIFTSVMPLKAEQHSNEYTPFAYTENYQVTVNVDLLNVRTGPGMHFQLIGQLKKGDNVDVYGTMNDWLVVQLPDNSIGVIKAEHTKLNDLNYDLQLANVGTNEIDQISIDTFSFSSDDRVELTMLVNFERENNSLASLKIDDKLSAIAQLKAEEMSSKKYLGHKSPEYGSLFEMLNHFNINYRSASENIIASNSINSAFTTLINSKNHKVHIYSNRFTKMGIGVCEDSTYGKIIVQILAE